MESRRRTVGKEKVSQDQVKAILKLASSGLSPDAIRANLKLSTNTVQQVLANDPMHRVAQQLKTQELQALHEDFLPPFIYSYRRDTNLLYRTSLVTGARSIHRVPSYQFKYGCYWRKPTHHWRK
jgi:hypothetical protein